MKPRALSLSCRAKINHNLIVGPRLDGGYHEIHTLFQEISLEDTLRLRLSDGPPAFITEGRPAPAGPKNLVWRALEKLKKKTRGKGNFQVYLKKRIPIGAGLGGGSSDAASALLGGWWLLKNKPGRPRRRNLPPFLFQIARSLGADVPFFLKGGAAKAEGIGDLLTPVPGAGARWLVLIFPGVHVSTKKAYGWLDRARAGAKSSGFQFPRNDFERVIFPRFPRVKRAADMLIRAGAKPVQMSGSGSAVYGFVSGKAEAERVKRSLPANLESWVCKTL